MLTRAGQRTRDYLARLPLLRAKELVYDERFFLDVADVHVPMYRALADAIVNEFAPADAVDVGCGIGWILERLQEHGVRITGIEGSRHAIARSPLASAIVRANLERGVPDLGRFDVAICIEVAEHLPARAAASLVDGLCRLGRHVVFTAAPPGQGGIHHVNEQPPEYWFELFERSGYTRSPATDRLLGAISEIREPSWMHRNLLVFAPSSG